jgi:protocatechuate 3,4-dioxygenase beta subunit
VPQPTADDGTFVFPADHNSVRRYRVSIRDLSNATINGSALSPDQQNALSNATGSIDVHYELKNINATLQNDGSVKITGDAVFATGDAPPSVSLYAFRMFGTVTDTNGNPVEGAVVSTRAPEYRWTLSDPADSEGNYQVPFWPNSTAGYRVVVIDAAGTLYQAANGSQPSFEPLKSARLDITLDKSAHTLTFTSPQSVDGIIYQGLLIGVATQDGQPVKPVSATWPDENGHFSLVLPGSAAGKTLSWWQSSERYFSAIKASPGGDIDVSQWPTTLDPTVPHNFANITLPG